jgi:hypothetical protein
MNTVIKEHPILFSAEMVRAILEGRKTQTRRIIKPQPIQCSPDDSLVPVWSFDGELFVGDDHMKDYLFHEVYGNKGTRYGSVYSDGTADRLWVREKWATHPFKNKIKPSDLVPDETPIFYRADKWENGDNYHYLWRPSIHMPRWASRINLEIVNVRVERLHEISEEDARAEGIVWQKDFGSGIETRNVLSTVLHHGTRTPSSG